MRAATISLIATAVVVVVKLAAAWLSGSVSVLAEGLQSTVDVVVSLSTVLTLRYAALPPDAEHPYGHGKAELISSAIQMLLVLGSCGFILYKAYERFRQPSEIRWDWGAAAMAYTVVSNSLVASRLRRASASTGSAALRSEAVHLVADSYSSFGVLIGMFLVGATGWTGLDPAVACAFVLTTMFLAGRQLGSVIHPLMDGSLPAHEVRMVEQSLHRRPEVRGYHNLRTRQVGSARFIELHVMLDDGLSFVRAHELAEEIEEDLRRALGGAVVSIHYEPHEAEVAHRAREHAEG
jgi:cation diffusion facilitator family transporter